MSPETNGFQCINTGNKILILLNATFHTVTLLSIKNIVKIKKCFYLLSLESCWSKKKIQIKYDSTHLDTFPGAALLVPMVPHYSLVVHPRENSSTWVQLISIPLLLLLCGEIRAVCCSMLGIHAAVRVTIATSVPLVFLFRREMWLELETIILKGCIWKE